MPPRSVVSLALFLFLAAHTVCGLLQRSPTSPHLRRPTTTKLHGVWGNYAPDTKQSAQVGVLIALAILSKSVFAPVSVRTTYACPNGFGAAERLAEYKAADPSYTCASGPELFVKMLTAKIVLPGDPEFDTQLFRLERRSMK